MNNTPEELQLYFARIRPIYRELFGMAHAICGNVEMAEYVLQRAILEGWTRRERGPGRVGFREGMRASLRRIAVQQALQLGAEDAELTWNELAPDVVGEPEDGLDAPEDGILLKAIHAESPEMRRLLMLHYGCGLRSQTIARLTDTASGQVQAQLDQFASRTRRKLPTRLRRQFDTALSRLIREALIQTSAGVPDPGTVYRTFEVEASQTRRSPRRYLFRALNAVVLVVLVALCAGLFWLIAVLMQSTEPAGAPDTPAAGETAEFFWTEG